MKSYVSMEQHVCPVCGVAHDTGVVLLDKRLRDSMESHTITGWSLCPEHAKLFEDGYIALIGCRTAPKKGDSPGDLDRDGRIARLRSEVWENVFDVPAPRMKDGSLWPYVAVESGVIDALSASAN